MTLKNLLKTLWERKLKNSTSLKLEGIEPFYLVCSIPLWTSTKFFLKKAPGVKTGPAPWSSNIGTKMENFKLFSEFESWLCRVKN